MLEYITHQGQNNFILDVDGEWMFRFPKHSAAADELERECRLLQVIKTHIHSCRIPEPVLHRNHGPVYAVYPKISGTSISRQLFDDLQPAVRRAAAQQISAFLRELHSIPASALGDADLPLTVTDRVYWQDFLSRLEVHVFPHIRPEAADRIRTDFSEFLNDPANFQYTPVLIHGDLGAVNLLWNAGCGRLEGVIDFGQASLGDPACDIASLICPRSLGEDLVPLLCSVYPEVTHLLDRARFYISTFALQDALFGAEHGDEEAFCDGISSYV